MLKLVAESVLVHPRELLRNDSIVVGVARRGRFTRENWLRR